FRDAGFLPQGLGETAMSESRSREEICEFGKSLFDRGLTAGSSGNISVRLEDGWLLTPTNACLGRLDPARLAKLDWNCNLLSGDPKLGDAIRGLAGKHSAVLLANHGPVVSGATLEAAVYATEELEETAKLFLLLQGHNPRALSEEQVMELKQVFTLDI